MRIRRMWRSFIRWYRRSKRNRTYAHAGGGVFLVLLLYAVFLSAPMRFPEGMVVKVPKGESVRSIAAKLKENKIIRSKLLFETMVQLRGGNIIAGEYSFQRRSSVFSVGSRVATGDFKITPIRIKILEGSTVREIAALLSEKIPDFNDIQFLKLAKEKEGYLFPDTYFILPGATPETVLTMLENAFEESISRPDVAAAIQRSRKSLSDIVIMASLLEKEVPSTYDRRVIAGILWRRIELDMPLQVDAVFPYFLGKNSFELTRADLAIDNPYNTYANKGLPVGPIANPSLDAILAAATPIQTNYLYYLSDRHSNLHYSVTYGEHLAAKRKYLGG